MEPFITFRQNMHRYPELSGNEIQASKRIVDFMNSFEPDEVLKIGKTSLLFIFDSQKQGPTTVFRADIDALPIQEQNDIDYISTRKNIAHLCGHDGHTSIVLALASKIVKQRPLKGKVGLLFQSAEETGQGAKEIVEDNAFRTLNPDYIFGLHNIPGYPKHRILLKKGNFAAASKGMTVKLYGKTSHAAEPENGINPAMAVSKIIADANQMITNKKAFKSLVVLTFVHIKLGEIAFGTSAGYAEMQLTLRAFDNEDMQKLEKQLTKSIATIARDERLGFDVDYSEVFPATENHVEAVELIEDALKDTSLSFEYLKAPFKWSEDFGHYLSVTQGAFLGLGAGEKHPALHNPNYNFPDELIETGATVFYSIAQKINY